MLIFRVITQHVPSSPKLLPLQFFICFFWSPTYFKLFLSRMLHILSICAIMICENFTISRRNEDFCNVFRNILIRFPHIATDDAINIAIHSPAREYYISEDRALRYCYRLSARRPLGVKRHSAKYHCITTLYYTARTISRERGITLRQAVIDTIYTQAPRFYISETTAYEITKHLRK